MHIPGRLSLGEIARLFGVEPCSHLSQVRKHCHGLAGYKVASRSARVRGLSDEVAACYSHGREPMEPDLITNTSPAGTAGKPAWRFPVATAALAEP